MNYSVNPRANTHRLYLLCNLNLTEGMDAKSPALVLSQETLGLIFLGTIDHWRHPDIVATNPSLTLPDAHITRVVRSGGSGTSEIFTRALSLFSPDWNDAVGISSSPDWPANRTIMETSNSNIPPRVILTPNSIGYTDFYLANSFAMNVASMRNHAGDGTVVASDESLAQAVFELGKPQGNETVSSSIFLLLSLLLPAATAADVLVCTTFCSYYRLTFPPSCLCCSYYRCNREAE